MPVVRKKITPSEPIARPIISAPVVKRTTMYEAPAPVRSTGNPILRLFFIVLAAIIIVVGYYGFYYFYRQYKNVAASPSVVAEQEGKALVDKVGQLVVLPVGETPTIATVADKEKLKDSPLLARAEAGDKVLVYTKSLLMVLYRPSVNKVVEIVPIAGNNTPAQNVPVLPLPSATSITSTTSTN